MSELTSRETIEIVRGGIDPGRAEELLAFWSGHGVSEEEARRRLPELVAVLRDEGGRVAGLGSVAARELALVGGRRFWLYESVLAPEAVGAGDRLLNATFAALEADFDSSKPGPLGLCLFVDDPAELERRPAAVWPETKLIYAGYADTSQVRIRYLHDAIVGPGLPSSPRIGETATHDYELEDRYRIEALRESDSVGPGDVLEFWAREGAVPTAEAQRRVHEVLLIGLDSDDTLAGVSTVYLRRNEQLGMDLWHFRTLVGREHRHGRIAVQLLWRTRDRLEELFVSGEDTRGSGFVTELENEGVKRYFNRAVWMRSDTYFIGENARGDHVRVHYFPGATVPLPHAEGSPLAIG